MTGVEILKGMSMAFRGYTWGASLYEAPADIAEQIEREHAEDCLRMGERAADVSMSAYDLLPADEREAIAWVRDHGGLEEVKAEWDRRSNLKRQLEKAQAKVERQQRHIEFVQGKCRERQGRIVELSKELAELRKVLSDYRDALGGMCERLGITDGTSLPEMPDVICEALDRRLMPEGYEWPRYEGGPLLRYGDSYIGNDGGNHRAWQIRFDSNADVHVSRSEDGDGFDRTTWDHFNKGQRVKRPAPAVLAADGEPLEVGQTAWDVDGYGPLVVKALPSKGEQLVVLDDGGTNFYRYPEKLTHERPDSWERIEEDIADLPCSDYCNIYRIDVSDTSYEHAMARDIVRRCKALAERERGE